MVELDSDEDPSFFNVNKKKMLENDLFMGNDDEDDI